MGIKAEEENPVVLEVLKVVLSFPTDVHVALQSSALGVLSELARWFNLHPQYLGDVLTFICARAHITGLGLSCMTAVCDISEMCQSNMLPHFDTLLQVSREPEVLLLKTTLPVCYASHDSSYGFKFSCCQQLNSRYFHSTRAVQIWLSFQQLVQL